MQGLEYCFRFKPGETQTKLAGWTIQHGMHVIIWQLTCTEISLSVRKKFHHSKTLSPSQKKEKNIK